MIVATTVVRMILNRNRSIVIIAVVIAYITRLILQLQLFSTYLVAIGLQSSLLPSLQLRFPVLLLPTTGLEVRPR